MTFIQVDDRRRALDHNRDVPRGKLNRGLSFDILKGTRTAVRGGVPQGCTSTRLVRLGGHPLRSVYFILHFGSFKAYFLLTADIMVQSFTRHEGSALKKSET